MSFEKLGFGIRLSTLDSGLNIITKKMPGNLVYSGLTVRSGAVYDPAGFNGLSHLIEHCIFDGVKQEGITEDRPFFSDHRINWEVEGGGGTMNGFNSYQTVTYVQDFNRKDLPFMLDLLLRVVLLPKLSRHSVNYQRNIICAELARDKENPLYGDRNSTFFDEMLREMMFRVNPIKNRGGGKKEDVLKIKPAMVREAFSGFYAPNNMALIVLSSLNHGEIVDLVRKFENSFGHLMPSQIKNIPRLSQEALKERRLEKEVKVWESDHFEHLVINTGFRAPMVSHRDYTPIRILNGIMGGFSFGRLYRNFREIKGHSYFAESRYFRTTIHGEWVVHANFHPKVRENPKDIIDRAQEFVQAQLREISAGKISIEEFEHAKKALFNHDRKFGLEDPEWVRDTLVAIFGSNNFSGGESISRDIEKELDSALWVRDCSFKRFVAAVNRQIDPERYALLVSGPPGCYSS